MLGELLLALDRPAEALLAFEQSLRNDPNRFRSVHGAARAAELAGDRGKARTYYSQLLAQGADAQGRPEIEQARRFLRRAE
jgi:tetratricopeptide (TPR) repeat protein